MAMIPRKPEHNKPGYWLPRKEFIKQEMASLGIKSEKLYYKHLKKTGQPRPPKSVYTLHKEEDMTL